MNPPWMVVDSRELYALRYVSLPDGQPFISIDWQAYVPKILSHQQEHFKPWT